jgi:hypothetical protein
MGAGVGAWRGRHNVGYIGINQSGKSHKMDRDYREWVKYNPDGYVELISKRGGYWVPGADLDPKLLYPRLLEITNGGMGPFRDRPSPRVQAGVGGILRCEDIDGYLPDRIRGTPWYPIVRENAHLHLDFQWNANRPQDVNKTLIGSSHRIYLFMLGEGYAEEYMRGQPALRDSLVVRRNLWPKRVGQYIRIDQDPNTMQAVSAQFFDDYDPRFDSRLKERGHG